jgi:hypothetical protein
VCGRDLPFFNSGFEPVRAGLFDGQQRRSRRGQGTGFDLFFGD